MTTDNMAELLTTVLNSVPEQALGALLEPSFGNWLSRNPKVMPINGQTALLIRDQQIDCQAGIGDICLIERGGVVNDVYTFAKRLGLYGVYAAWANETGHTYVASTN